MKLAAVIATTVYAQKATRVGKGDTDLVEEHDYDADNWLDVEWAEDLGFYFTKNDSVVSSSCYKYSKNLGKIRVFWQS